MFKKRTQKAFTLIELMIIIVILGVLGAVATTKMRESSRKARDSNAKANLGLMRSILNVYYADNFAYFPTGTTGESQSTLEDTLVPRYIAEISQLHIYPYHPQTNKVDNIASGDFNSSPTPDEGGYVYVANDTSSDWGRLAIECTHQDVKGNIWTAN